MFQANRSPDPTQADKFTAKWRSLLKTLQTTFPSPWKEVGEEQSFENTFLTAVALLDKMKHPRVYGDQDVWKENLGAAALPDYSACKDVQLEDHAMPLVEGLKDLVGL